MGKKKDPYAKGFEGYLDRYKANDKLADQYGVDKSQYQTRHGQMRPGMNPLNKGTFDEYEDAIARAVGNDYDTRESLKYAQDSGNKRAQKVGTVDDIESAYKASTFMRKTHNKKMGHGGGDYDGTKAEDQAGVADYWFNQSRDKFGAGFATPGDIDAMSVEQQQAAATTAEPYKESEDLTKAKERVQAWQSSQSGSALSPYGQR
tara:strand:+ start:220 stop:831 length:612 start_codon:yes stop_codon:yes gene_type:complete